MKGHELKSLFSKLPDLTPVTTWDKHRLALRKHVAKDNKAKFLRWSTIQATMFVGEAPYIRNEYDDLMADDGVWKQVIKETDFGNAYRLSYAPYTSGNLVHQGYHLLQLNNVLKSLNYNPVKSFHSIFEVGAGYGAMALLIHRLGFSGRYHFYDFPECHLLREWYLSNVDIYTKYHSRSVPMECNLFIALFSLSEMPLADRVKVMNVDADVYLIGYQPIWDGVHNTNYFKEFAGNKPDYHWVNYFNPHYTNHWYLIGVRK